MKKLVFICKGNMFRSQIAEALFNQNPVSGWQAFSYGTCVQEEGRQNIKLSTYGKGIQITIDEMQKLGIDISNKYCDQIHPDHLKDADKVIVMSEIDFVPDWLGTRHDERWEIPNPEIILQNDARDVIKLLNKKIVTLKKSL